MSALSRIVVPPSLTPRSVEALAAGVDRATENAGIVVLEGGPETFCAGLEPDSLEESWARRGLADAFVDLVLAIRRSSRPFVALVEGGAYGGGVGLAAACDVVVAARSATFGLPEVLFGLAPLTIRPLLLERMTPQAVRRMAMTGAGRSADDAAAMGLVDEVVDAGGLDDAMARWTRALRRALPDGVGALKRHAADADGLEDALRDGARRLEELLAGTDALSRARALRRGDVPWRTP